MPDSPTASRTVPRQELAWARLLRLSNAPTAIADVWMGYAVATGGLAPCWPLVWLTVSSLCVYHAGMALNDAVDADDDRQHARARPIAQGLVSRPDAYVVACGLGGLGMVFAVMAAWAAGKPEPVVLGALLLLLIYAYNSRWKRTVVGPLIMGACRAGNGLLGASVGLTAEVVAHLAPGALAYVAGLTLFARDESGGGRRPQLFAGAMLAISGVAWLALRPGAPSGVAALLWAAAAVFALRGMAAALLQPTPQRVGRGVGIAIQGLVVINATLATLHAGPTAGLAILALLPVTQLLALFIPQT